MRTDFSEDKYKELLKKIDDLPSWNRLDFLYYLIKFHISKNEKRELLNLLS